MGKTGDPKIELVWYRGKWAIYYYDPETQKPTRRSTRTSDREVAENVLQQWETDLRKQTGTTVADLLDYRFTIVKETLEYPGAMIHDMNMLKRHIGTIDGSQLTRSDTESYINKRRPYLPAARRELSTLNAALRLAVSEGLIDTARIAKRPAPPPPREHYATKEQINQLISPTDIAPHLRLFILIASLTGRRSGAILDLKWDRVFFDTNIVDFNRPGAVIKNKRRGVCRMSGLLKDVLGEAYRSRTSDFVIEFRGVRIRSIKKAFKRQVERTGLPEWLTPHVIRHSVASWMAMDKVQMDEIGDFTDLDEKTVKRVYRKFNPDYLAQVADGLSQGIKI